MPPEYVPGLPDPVVQRRVGNLAHFLPDRAVVEVRRDGQVQVQVGDESLRTGHDTLDGRDDLVDRHHVAPDAVGGRAVRRGLGAADERPGGVVHVLHVVPPAVPDHVRPVQQGGLDRLRGVRGQPEVPPRSVHRPWPQAYAGNAVIEEVHPGVRLVALLEDAVVGHGPQHRVVVHGPGAVVVLHAVDRR